MNIIHFNHSFYTGGVESLLCGLLNGISTSHKVTFCTFRKMNPDEGMMPNLSKDVKYVHLGNDKLTKVNKVLNIFKILFLLVTGKYDVVHLHGAFNYYILSIFLLHKQVKFFYTVHSDAYMENGPMSKKFLAVKKYCFEKKYIVPITISPSSQRSFAELYGCKSELIENGIQQPNVNNCVDLIRSFRYSSQTRVFTHIGRICVAKNQLVLCKVFQRLIDEGNDVVLLIIGPQEIEQIFEDISKFFSERIVYLGPKSNVSDYLNNSDAMCLPSVYEGLPITLLESLAVGCVPICSPVGGIVNVISNGNNGLLSESSNEQDYYNIIKKFLALSKDEVSSMKIRCRDSFSYYDIKNTVAKYISCYESYVI